MAHLRPAPGHRQVLTVTVVRVSTYQSPDAWMRAQSRPHQADAEVAGDEHPLHPVVLSPIARILASR
jgi:hypothetical protein